MGGANPYWRMPPGGRAVKRPPPGKKPQHALRPLCGGLYLNPLETIHGVVRPHRSCRNGNPRPAIRFQVFDEPVRGTIEPNGDVDAPAERGRERLEHHGPGGERAVPERLKKHEEPTDKDEDRFAMEFWGVPNLSPAEPSDSLNEVPYTWEGRTRTEHRMRGGWLYKWIPAFMMSGRRYVSERLRQERLGSSDLARYARENSLEGDGTLSKAAADIEGAAALRGTLSPMDVDDTGVPGTPIEEIYEGSRFNQSSVPRRLVRQDNLAGIIDGSRGTAVSEVSK